MLRANISLLLHHNYDFRNWFFKTCFYKVRFYRDVAQPGSVLRSGRRGRWFESSHPDTENYLFAITNSIATLAQLVEQLIRNEQVVGSSPISGSQNK